jgi:acetyl/propionyl-CoA carboxylase alpha subunit
MLAKVITLGHDRAEAVRKMERALRETAVLGVKTNISYLLAILAEENFRAGQTSTHYIREHMTGWRSETTPELDDWLALAAAEFLLGEGKTGGGGTAVNGEAAQLDPWQLVGPWRNVDC